MAEEECGMLGLAEEKNDFVEFSNGEKQLLTWGAGTKRTLAKHHLWYRFGYPASLPRGMNMLNQGLWSITFI